jgi:hypothetical protein
VAELDLTQETQAAKPSALVSITPPYNPDRNREETRGDLARGLLWLLTFVIGGVLVFVALGRLDGTVITQSVFPSLIALAGTALGFYFGSQSGKTADSADSSKDKSAPQGGEANPTGSK